MLLALKALIVRLKCFPEQVLRFPSQLQERWTTHHPCSHREMMGTVRKENFLLPDITPCLHEAVVAPNITLDSVGLCPQLAVLPARPRAPVIPCRTLLCAAQATTATCTRVCQLCNMGHSSSYCLLIAYAAPTFFRK